MVYLYFCKSNSNSARRRVWRERDGVKMITEEGKEAKITIKRQQQQCVHLVFSLVLLADIVFKKHLLVLVHCLREVQNQI